jgi:AraC family transcriptional regulator
MDMQTNFSGSERKPGRAATVQPRLLNLSIFINEHLSDELTLDFLAGRMNLSPFHFHRKFRAYFGESLHQHVKRLRLERSAHALLYRLSPVSVVARNSGYKTLSAFSHAFSAYFGIAPTRYRHETLASKLAGAEGGLRDRLGSAFVDQLAPAEIVQMPEMTLSFLRVDVARADDLRGACTALDQLKKLSGEPATYVAATTDLFGLLTGGAFRIEIGREGLPQNLPMRQELGESALTHGRYARFDYTGAPERLGDLMRAIHQFWLPQSAERARVLAHYLTFEVGQEPRVPVWHVYVPLEEGAGATGQS